MRNTLPADADAAACDPAVPRYRFAWLAIVWSPDGSSADDAGGAADRSSGATDTLPRMDEHDTDGFPCTPPAPPPAAAVAASVAVAVAVAGTDFRDTAEGEVAWHSASSAPLGAPFPITVAGWSKQRGKGGGAVHPLCCVLWDVW